MTTTQRKESAEARWRCLTCGFAWSRDAPPDRCPVCGAPRSQFSPIGRGKLRFALDVYESFRVHPVVVHLPSGVLPGVALFLGLALLTANPGLEHAASFFLFLVVLAIPVSMASGIHDWRRRYAGRKVPVFYRKIKLAAVLLALGVAAAVLRIANPDLMAGTGLLKGIYAAIVLVMLFLVVLLGHYGGKLVFEWEKPPKAAAPSGEDS